MTNRQILYCNTVKNESTLKPLQTVHKMLTISCRINFAFRHFGSPILFSEVLICTILLIYFTVFILAFVNFDRFNLKG